MTTKRTLLLSLALVILIAGCGERKMKLGGLVTFADDDAPVTSGFVIFTAIGADFQSRGKIGADGTYTLSSTGNNDGIPPGEYAVSLVGVEKNTQVDTPDGSYFTLSEPLILPKYTSPETSDLTFTVDGSTKRYDIQVERFRRR